MSQWYLASAGKKTGPFSIEELKDLLSSGNIQNLDLVTNDQLGDRWLTVQEILSHASRMPGSSENSGMGSSSVSLHFQPPPRPSELSREVTIEEPSLILTRPQEGGPPSAEMTLFETLQATRNKKNKLDEPLVSSEDLLHAERFMIPPQFWVFLTVAILSGTAIWFGTQLFSNKSGSESQKNAIPSAIKTSQPSSTQQAAIPPPVSVPQTPSAIIKTPPRFPPPAKGLAVSPPSSDKGKSTSSANVNDSHPQDQQAESNDDRPYDTEQDLRFLPSSHGDKPQEPASEHSLDQPPAPPASDSSTPPPQQELPPPTLE